MLLELIGKLSSPIYFLYLKDKVIDRFRGEASILVITLKKKMESWAIVRVSGLLRSLIPGTLGWILGATDWYLLSHIEGDFPS